MGSVGVWFLCVYVWGGGGWGEAYSCNFCALDGRRRGYLFMGSGESELAVEAGEQAGEVGGDDAGG